MFVQETDGLELTTVDNLHFSLGSARLGTIGLNLLDDLHTLDNLTEDAVSAVQMRSGNLIFIIRRRKYSGDEELRTIGVGTSVGHGQHTRLVVADTEVLIGKSIAVNGFTSITVEILSVNAPN